MEAAPSASNTHRTSWLAKICDAAGVVLSWKGSLIAFLRSSTKGLRTTYRRPRWGRAQGARREPQISVSCAPTDKIGVTGIWREGTVWRQPLKFALRMEEESR